MGTLQTTEDFRRAVAYLKNTDYFGAIILQLNIGDTVAECEVLDDETLTDITPDTATLESALDSANAEITQAENLAQAAAIALEQGKVYLRQQLLNPGPDATAIFNTIEAQVQSNPHLLQMVVNQRNLMSAAFGWGVLDTGTATGRIRYIMIVQQVIALLT